MSGGGRERAWVVGIGIAAAGYFSRIQNINVAADTAGTINVDGSAASFPIFDAVKTAFAPRYAKITVNTTNNPTLKHTQIMNRSRRPSRISPMSTVNSAIAMRSSPRRARKSP